MKVRWTAVAASAVLVGFIGVSSVQAGEIITREQPSAVLVGFIGVSSVQAGEIITREQRQQERIGQGVRSGELTAKETQWLKKEQGKIEADRQQALEDGKMTKKERARLHQEQDRASRHIYKQKHDAQKQPGTR